MERISLEAVVLGTQDYGDADRIVTLFTRNKGRVTAFAAGARKSKRRFAGVLEPTTHVHAKLVETRGDTWRLDGIDLIRSFHQLRDELPLIARALYALELCRELTRDHEAHQTLFDALVDYLTSLAEGKAGPTSLLKFELDTLECAGYMPHFAPCALCGGETGQQPRFDVAHGGMTCSNCAYRSPQGVPVSPEIVSALVGLQRGERTPLAAHVRARSRSLLNVFIAHHVGRKLKSVDFMEQIGAD